MYIYKWHSIGNNAGSDSVHQLLLY